MTGWDWNAPASSCLGGCRGQAPAAPPSGVVAAQRHCPAGSLFEALVVHDLQSSCLLASLWLPTCTQAGAAISSETWACQSMKGLECGIQPPPPPRQPRCSAQQPAELLGSQPPCMQPWTTIGQAHARLQSTETQRSLQPSAQLPGGQSPSAQHSKEPVSSPLWPGPPAITPLAVGYEIHTIPTTCTAVPSALSPWCWTQRGPVEQPPGWLTCQADIPTAENAIKSEPSR